MPGFVRLIIWLTARLLLLLAIFITGITVGVYYHNELLVLTGYYVAPDDQAVTVNPSLVLDSQTMLELATLTESLPLVFSTTLEEEQIQKDLKQGAVVLPLGTSFGQPGNVVVTAHSSGTAAFGPYRFAFSQLSEMKDGQEFSIKTPTHRYTYRVYGREIVWPHEVDKLPHDERSTVTLVTCWPLWTNFKRLLVHAELVGVEQSIAPLESIKSAIPLQSPVVEEATVEKSP